MSTVVSQGLNSELLITQGYFSSESEPGEPLPPNTDANILPPDSPAGADQGFIAVFHSDYRCKVRAMATGAFHLNLFSRRDVDGGATYVVKQVASSTITAVDGATTLYLNVAELDCPWPAVGKVQIFNTDVVDINWAVDYKLYRGKN
jgi:hypothetical protein